MWAQEKVYCRAYTNLTLVKPRQIIDPALDSVSANLSKKFVRKTRDHEQAYREAHTAGENAEEAVKLYKSQTRIFRENIN